MKFYYFLTLLVCSLLGAANTAGAAEPVDFVKDIQPIFVEHCNDCHGADVQEGRLRLDAKKIVYAGGESGPLFVSGKADKSLLIERLLTEDENLRMPFEADPLSSDQIELLKKWVNSGAPWPDGVGPEVTTAQDHWAYKKPVKPELPVTKFSDWVRNPLDAFIAANCKSKASARPCKPTRNG